MKSWRGVETEGQLGPRDGRTKRLGSRRTEVERVGAAYEQMDGEMLQRMNLKTDVLREGASC